MGNCGVFEIRNIVTGQVYIGYSIDLKHRETWYFRQLINGRLNKKCSALQSSFNKYGEENFQFNILEYCDEENLIQTKQIWMDCFKSYNKETGFNSYLTADCSTYNNEFRKSKENNKNALGLIHSEETRKRMSILRKGKKLPPFSEEHKKNISLSKKGKKASEETKERQRLKKIGNKNCLGNKLTLKHRENISQSLRKYKNLVLEWKELISQGLNYFQIARKYNIKGHDTIKKYLTKYYPENKEVLTDA